MPSTSEQPEVARIARIPDLLVNQIAAGEVVERPASALKEILENSLDAGSHRIEVLLRDGGMSELTVVDDGAGIHPDDLALCLERHATSKIRKGEDLESIGTYGFRGEALASIASVAEVEIKSRTRDAARAMQIAVQYGEQQGEPRPVGAPIGTSLTVRNLFARLPARQKFLRSAATEFSHCARIVKELAVGNPSVSFTLHHQGRRVNAFLAATRVGRIQEAFSWDWEPLRVQEQTDDLDLDAYLTPADRTQDRGELLLFINQRPVRNRGLLSAIRQAYLSTLGPHHDPSGVVYLDIRKDWVDVNVHPQKTEVRCLKQESLYGWILSAIRKAVSQQNTIRPAAVGTHRPLALATPAQLDPGSLPVFDRPLATASAPVAPSPSWAPPPAPRYQQTPLLEDVAGTLFGEGVAEKSTSFETARTQPSRRWRYLGQARAAYLICEDAEGILLVDQHALHEKFRYEELRRKHLDGGLQSQRLLLPKILRLAPEWLPVLEENAAELAKLGFEIEAFGDGDWAIKAIPELVTEEEAEKIVLETLREIRRAGPSPAEVTSRALTPVLATLACHSVVRAGQTLSDLEAEALLENIDALEMGWTCPHGRPVVFRLGYSEIEKHFERK